MVKISSIFVDFLENMNFKSAFDKREKSKNSIIIGMAISTYLHIQRLR